MSTFLDLSGNLLELLEEADKQMEEVGKITPDLESEISGALVAKHEKVDSIARFDKGIRARIKAIKDEEASLYAGRKRLERALGRLEEYLLYSFDATNQVTAHGDVYEIKVRNNPPKVVIANEEQIPAEYWEIVQTKRLKKTPIKDAIKSGTVVPGAHLETGRKVVIK